MKSQVSLYKNNYLYIPVKVRKLLGIYKKKAELSFICEKNCVQLKVLD